MSERDFDAVFYVKTVPEIRFEDELYHICYKVGRGHFEFVMRPNIFIKARMLAMEALAEGRHHSTDDGNVSRMRRKK
jgi:hypothetical protein